MSLHSLWSVFTLLVCCSLVAMADDLPTRLFAQSPTPALADIMLPRALVVDTTVSRCYVLDSGLERVVSFTTEGRPLTAWPLTKLGVDLSGMPADPLMPAPVLATGGGSTYLLFLDRSSRRLDVHLIEGTGKSRVLVLPDGGMNGAIAMDTDGQVLLAYFDVVNEELVLTSEDKTGTFTTLGALTDPCDGQTTNIAFTGFAVRPDGQLAIGITQSGAQGYSFIRSWLLQGTIVHSKLNSDLRVTHRFSLLDAQGKLLERFRAAQTLAGQDGYPLKPCVPLFTSLAFGADNTIISGGHTLDPFLRTYTHAGALLSSIPWNASGGQHLAALPSQGSVRLFILDSAQKRVLEITPVGGIVNNIGRPMNYSLQHTIAMTADADHVYVAVQLNPGFQLIRFTTKGQCCWTLPLVPPSGMGQALPMLTTARDRVLVGWRLPKAAGIGWVDTVMEDGTPGVPLWTPPYTAYTKTPAYYCPSPLITGDNGRVYILRETKEGLQLQSYSSTGVFLFTFPNTLQGITAVFADGNMAWVKANSEGMIIVPYSDQGVEKPWKRIPRDTDETSRFLPVPLESLWGWLTSTNSLLKLDAQLIVVDELHIKTPEGQPLINPSAITGDGKENVYIALPDQLLMAKP